MCAALTGPTDGLLAAFATFTKAHYGEDFGSSCYYSTVCLSDVSYAAQWPNQREWVYQCCAQWAFWQTAPATGSLRSTALTLDYFTSQCTSAFGLPATSSADGVAKLNAAFGGRTPTQTNVVALNGADDPWQGATQNITRSPSYPEITAVCDGCGHCGDLHGASPSDPPSLTAQRAGLSAFLAAWLA